MSASDPEIILLRFSGEIATKARPTRRRFEAHLLRNVRAAVRDAGITASVTRSPTRIFVASGDAGAAATLARVFGLQSLAIAQVHPAEKLDEVVRLAYERFRDAVAGRRFAVRARRVGERSHIALDPRAIERALGTRLLEHAARVDLDDPEVSVPIELHGAHAYLCTREWRGQGGLPLGVEGSAVALLSGGFDSAVAAWQMLRRGVHLDYAFCNLGGRAHELGVLRVAQVLGRDWSHGGAANLHAIDFAEVTAEIRAKTRMRYWQLLLKRQMLRAGEAIARLRHSDALVTGDAVGQVSSQTLSNLATVSAATSLPILRPLVGANKDEIIRRAEQIGTARLSAVVQEYCAMVPTRPATSSRAEIVAAEEALLDPATLQRAIATRRVIDLRSLDLDAHGIPGLEVDTIDADTTVIDLRSRTAFAAWHWPDALHLDFERARVAWRSFAKDQRYVLYCEFGLKSAHLAEQMCAAGFDAANFHGGLKALVALARARRLATPDLMATPEPIA